MKNIGKYLGVLAGFTLLILIFLYNNSAIGTYKTNVEKDARVSQRIPDDWQVAKAETKRISSMLFYEDSEEKYIISIYVNNQGFSFGYFFRYGAAGENVNDALVLKMKGFDEKIYMSMNKQQIAKIEINTSNGVEIKDIDNSKPFTIILPANSEILKMYDINGDIVESKYYTRTA